MAFMFFLALLLLLLKASLLLSFLHLPADNFSLDFYLFVLQFQCLLRPGADSGLLQLVLRFALHPFGIHLRFLKVNYIRL